jgi:hypothetical protein
MHEGRYSKAIRLTHPLILIFLGLNLLDCLLSLRLLGTTEGNPLWGQFPIWYKLPLAALVVILFRKNIRILVYLTAGMVAVVMWNLSVIGWSWVAQA